MSNWIKRTLTLPEYQRGFHLITDIIIREIPEISQCRSGFIQLSLLHTSASLTVNENADPSVRTDMESFSNAICPDNTSYFIHTFEGQDDMPAHVKSSLFGAHLSLSIDEGRLVLGTWQGIYLGEHRNNGGNRKIHVMLLGDIAGS